MHFDQPLTHSGCSPLSNFKNSSLAWQILSPQTKKATLLHMMRWEFYISNGPYLQVCLIYRQTCPLHQEVLHTSHQHYLARSNLHYHRHLDIWLQIDVDMVSKVYTWVQAAARWTADN
jgi:hypothetical protein